MSGEVDGWLAEREPRTDGHMAEQAGLAEELDTAQVCRKGFFLFKRPQRVSVGDCGHRK